MSLSFSLAALVPETVELYRLSSFWPVCPGSSAEKDLQTDIDTHNLRRPLLAFVPDSTSQDLALLDGHKRLRALLALGHTQAPTLIIPQEIPLAQALGLALAQNRERSFNPGETALIWNFLTNLNPELALSLAPFLDLHSPKLGQWNLAAAHLIPAGLTALAQGKLDLENGARLSGWAPPDQEVLLNLFGLLNPSKQKKRQWLDWLEDLSRREKDSPAQLLTALEIKSAVTDIERSGAPATEEICRQYLWSRRHPRLAELTRQRQTRLKALKLPPALRLELDPTLEDLKFGLQLNFTNLDEFKTLADLTLNLAVNGNFQSLLDDSPHD